ncbi:hypothetical protein LTR47_011258 [Exophiala xenobiotica]|nr:hypothetical protein LTR92_010759 [Exophiala xenobiotica]KAK5202978.1 hypothetical protein LTR41_011296 [Exophiala xenobiotica]KAK5220315.1 hypothetical protein LTR47_011258 [Exophiala xenobiotica]KAK5247790.1 hypothetical protein LTS06_007093 [Exophiala xenobiotica]KAK5262064.1 hypothetical protein LTR40_000994 [Exophiala xenobiotica]
MARFVDLTSCLQSPLITVLAGENRHHLAADSFVLSASQSTSLRALVKGSWKEGTDRTVDWSHTDLKTIQRDISFLYFQDYEAPDPQERIQDIDESLPDEKTQDAVRKANEHEAAGNASSGADGHAQDGQEALEHGQSEEEPVEPGSQESEIEPEPARRLSEAVDAELARSPELLPAGSDNSIDEPQVQSDLFESTLERPLTPVLSCVGLPPAIIVRRTLTGMFADREYPYKECS